MSRIERFGTRDMRMSQWHRTLSGEASCISFEFVEYCRRCYTPLALIETGWDKGQRKPTAVVKKLANMAGIPAYCIMYQADCEDGPLTGARLFRIEPPSDLEHQVSMEKLGSFVESIHRKCTCQGTSNHPGHPQVGQQEQLEDEAHQLAGCAGDVGHLDADYREYQDDGDAGSY